MSIYHLYTPYLVSPIDRDLSQLCLPHLIYFLSFCVIFCLLFHGLYIYYFVCFYLLIYMPCLIFCQTSLFFVWYIPNTLGMSNWSILICLNEVVTFLSFISLYGLALQLVLFLHNFVEFLHHL